MKEVCDMINFQIQNVTNRQFKAKIARSDFRCLRVDISSDNPFLENVRQKAASINRHLNSHSANTGTVRSDETVSADNLIGLIAEYACYEILKNKLGEANVIKPSSDSSRNQVDIQLVTGHKIEVRSSCIKNGLEFALFSQYIDVIGPYYNNTYKSYENVKDFYMRVIYVGETGSIYNDILKGSNVSLYITGGATKQMLKQIGYRKNMTSPADNKAAGKGNYLAVQIAYSFDYPDFIDQLINVL